MSSLAALVKEVKHDIDEFFLADVLEGLSKPQKTLPCKYFYDEVGSQLFEEICDTPEYYVTRTECDIYRESGNEMAQVVGEKALIIEPGAGSVKKIALLLEHIEQPAGFIPMDISPEILQAASGELAQQFPDVDIIPIVSDFMNTRALSLFFQQLPDLSVNKRVIFFPGSTIGNFHPDEAKHFLQRFAQNLLPGDGLLIGVDLIKDHDHLESAYNDDSGVTAAFNLNLLHRINNELDGNLDVSQFSHRAIFNSSDSRIEMHLVSEQNQQLVLDGQTFHFEKHETIHTENSYKYNAREFHRLAVSAGYKPRQSWMDKQQLFSVHYLELQA